MTSRKSENVVSDSLTSQESFNNSINNSLISNNSKKHNTSENVPLLTSDNEDDNKKQQQHKHQHHDPSVSSSLSRSCSAFSCHCRCCLDGKKVVGFIFFGTIALLLWDAILRPPEQRLFLKPNAAKNFLMWVEANPYWGLGAFLIVIAVCVVLLIPIGTPLTLGCGYIYKGVYGWTAGVAVATAVSMAGSALGAVCCFLLGRYMMRDWARKWVRKYPLLDAIDAAVSEHGLKIMAMLYLTPVLPLGPVSYMCGSTSMALSSFVLAKVASLPLMLLYVYIGAAAGTLIADADAIEHNSTLILSGILLSVIMISCISHYIRKELMTILEGKKKGGKKQDGDDDIELGGKTVSASRVGDVALQRRHVAHQVPMTTTASSTATTATTTATLMEDHSSESDANLQKAN